MSQKKDVSTELWRGIAFVVIGIIVIIYFAKDVINSFTEPPYMYDLSVEDVKDGTYVQDEIYVALDYFMYEETSRTRYGVKTSSYISSYYYIVPVLTEDVEEELYMAVEVSSSAENAMNAICDDTYAYLTGELPESQFGYKTYPVKGSIRDMKSEELQYMVEWFQETQYFGTTNAEEIKQYIVPVVLEKYNGTMARVAVVVAAIFVLIGLLMVKHCSGVRRRQKKEEEYRMAYRNASESRYPQQGMYPQNGTYPQQGMYPQNGTYPQQGMYPQQSAYPQGNMNQPNNVYSQPSGYQPNNVYSQPSGYQPNNVYSQPNGYQPNNVYSQPNENAMEEQQEYKY